MTRANQASGKRTVLLFAALFVTLLAVLAVPRSFAEPAQGMDGHMPTGIHLERIGSIGGDGAEIAAYDEATEQLFVASGSDKIEILDISDPTMPAAAGSFSVSDLGDGANSVAAHGGVVAVAIAADPSQDPGKVGFYDTAGNLLSSVTAGALPDMITFTPDGQKVVVANEGEPDDDYLVDPEGSVTVVDVSGGAANVTQADVTQIGFTDFNVGGPRHGELDPAVRIFGPNATVAQDLEPEYVAVSGDSLTAWVTLQENNAVAVIDLSDNSVAAIKGLGTKDWSLPENQLDASDRDGLINIRNWPVQGMYQPDAIASFEVGGQTYLLTANEGDAREYEGDPGFVGETRVEDETLDPTAFPNAAELQMEENLGRLKITVTEGQNNEGAFTELYAYGARSFSIWAADGTLVQDSGSQIANLTAVLSPDLFNSQGAADSFDERSDDKGAEPEGVTKGVVDGRTYAFVGLERIGGIMVYDVTDPMTPRFVQYQPALDGDISPEGLLFIPAVDSPNGKNLLVVTYEVSSTTTIFEFAGDGGMTRVYFPVIASDR